MNRIKKVIICLFACAILLGGGVTLTRAASEFPSETNPFGTNRYLDPINQEEPFFDVILPKIAENIKENNKHSISPTYDAFPLANNPENFQGLGSTTYANINGKTVTAEAFFRLPNEGLSDPNNGMGLLIYQCIQYKRAHPEEDVRITYSSYRTSCCAAVCVLPESKYYGYMRSLYTTNYDEHGFVRIAFMLTEAARMGIKVTAVNQLNSYNVKQYNPNTKTNQSRGVLSYVTYFNQALKSDCYDKYAPGKKVSDFMDFTKVGWTVEDKTGDMQHLKSATVSHYLATDGTEHRSGVYFGSANLDENNYRGANGNNGTQSGVIISDHDEIYRVTYNYTRLMYKYRGQEEMFTLRKAVNKMNEEQAALIKSGRGDEIPKDEQIIYLGTENDPVFEMYFTPFGGSEDSWDTQFNPFCKYIDKLPYSEDYIEFIWNEFGYGICQIGKTMERILEKAFCDNPNFKNKFSIRVSDFDSEAISKLALGSQIGYRSIKNGSGMHSKDILLSYKEDGVRHNVSLLSSCNFYPAAFSYRTNSLLVINETENSGGNFYNIMGEKYSYGMINNDLMVTPANLVLEQGDSYKVDAEYSGTGTLKWTTSKKSVATVSGGTIKAVKPGSATITVTDGKYKATVKLTVVECIDCVNADDGLTCSINEQYVLSKKLEEFPLTFESVFTVEQDKLTGTTTLMGSDGLYDPAVTFTLNKAGQPRVAIRDIADYSIQSVYVFNNVNVATGEKVHLAIVTDFASKQMHCYVNGKLAQTISGIAAITPFKEKHAPVIGGDHRNGNATYFPGVIEKVAVWSDVRTESEISADYSKGITASDNKLMVAYDLALCDECMKNDLSGSDNDLEYVALWLDKDDVDKVKDYEYSFAVIGDTQTMCEKDPDAMESIYDWILANKDKEKIEYVIGLGDITDDSTDGEWVTAKKSIGKLNGKVPYVLARGNHDDWDDFNRLLHDGYYETTVDGMMVPGDIELTDPSQPGLIETVLPDGSVALVTREGDTPEGGTVKGDLTNSYRYFNIQGTDYLIMTLDFAPGAPVLQWANDVIENHPNHKVIAVTHAYMYRDGTTIDAGDCYPPTYYTGYTDPQNGDDMWEKCFSKHDNVLMVLSGHDPWQHIVYRQDKGEKCNTVTQMLIDAQYVDKNIGSTAMVAMFYFSDDGNTLTVRYYSVEKDCYGSAKSQFTVNLNELDKHSYTSEVIKEPTCLSEGKKVNTCTVCDDTYIEVMPKLEHSYSSEFTVDKQATCTAVGSKSRHCTTNGCTEKTDVTTIAKIAHSYKDTLTKATLSKNGKIVTKCSACGDVKATQTVYYPKTFTLSATSYVYDKNAKKPTVTVKDYKGNTLKADTDYSVSYESGRKIPGKYTVKVTFKGKYTGTKRLYFTIKPTKTSKISATQTTSTITLKWNAVTGATGYRVYMYTSKAKKYEKIASVKTASYKVTKLSAGTSYKFKIIAYTKDDGTIWGSYSSVFKTATKPNTPTLKVTSTSKGVATLSWTNVVGETGYQVYFSTKKSSGYKKLSSYKANVVKGSRKKLTSKKVYYFKVRAYKETANGTLYSSWSSVKSVRVK